MQFLDDDVTTRGDRVSGPLPAPSASSAMPMIRRCLGSVTAGAATVRRTMASLSSRVETYANRPAPGGHQFWGDEE